MANNVEVTQGAGTTFKTTDNGGVHTGHVNVDSSALPTGAATAANQASAVTALQIIDDWDESDRAKVNPIVGQAGVAAGAGSVGATVQRVTLASDDPAVVDLAAIEILLTTLSGIVSSARAAVDLIAGQIGITAGAGSVAANTPRVTLASDDPAVANTGASATALAVIDDWDESDRAKVNPVVGQAGVAAGAGAVSDATQRVTLASDDPAVALLQTMDADTSALAATIASGRVKVAVDLALPAGTANIGDVDVLSVSGGVAANAADTATPVKVGARYDSTSPTYDNGDVTNLQADTRGSLHVALRQPGADAAISAGDLASDGLSTGTIGIMSRALGYMYNGSSVDRIRGDTTNGLLVNGPGLSVFRSLDLDETEEDVKTSAGRLYKLRIANFATSPVYVKLYNATAASVTVGSSTPIDTIVVPAASASDATVLTESFGGKGLSFSTALSMAATTALADADTGAPATNSCVVTAYYV